MSKPVKKLITDSYKKRFDGVTGAVIIDIRGLASNDNNALRSALADKGIRVSVVKNSLARRALNDTELGQLCDKLDGPNAFVYGGESAVHVARELVEQVKELKSIEFKGAIMDGIVFGPDEVEKLSKYPTRDEAQADVVQLILSPGRNLAGSILGPGSQIASIIKTIQDKLESGESIAKAG